MSLGSMIKKEVKELLTPGTIIAVAVMSLLFGSMGGLMGSIEEEAKEEPVIGIVDRDEGTFSGIATSLLDERAKVVYNGSGIEEGLREVEENEGVALIIITEDFSESILGNESGVIEVHWIMRGAGLADSISSEIVNALIYEINREISRALIESHGYVNSTVALNPTMTNETTVFKGKEMEGLSPGMISAMIGSQSVVIPLIMMMVVMMASSMVISSMGMEKENKTLETLLTLPVKRSSIIAGKIAGSAVVGLIMAVIYMIGFGYYMVSFQTSDLNLEDFGLALGLLDYVLIGISLFLALLGGLGLALVLGTAARDYKSAQTYTFPIMALGMIPWFLTMLMDFDTMPVALKGLTFLIPFSHPMMAPRALLFGDYALVLAGIAYLAIFASIMLFIAVRIFKSDRIVVGRIKKKKAEKGWKALWKRR